MSFYVFDIYHTRGGIMKNLIKKIALVGAGIATGLAVANKGKIKKEVDSLVKKGRITAKEGKKLASKLVDDAKKQEKIAEKKLRVHAEKIIKKTGVITKKQADAMQKRIKELEKKLQSFKKSPAKKSRDRKSVV